MKSFFIKLKVELCCLVLCMLFSKLYAYNIYKHFNLETENFELIDKLIEFFTSKNTLGGINVRSFTKQFATDNNRKIIKYNVDHETDISDIETNFEIVEIIDRINNFIYNYLEADYQINIPEPIGAPLAIKFRDKNNKTFLDCAMKENRVDLIEKLFKIPGIRFDFRPITSGVTRKNKIINVTTYVNEPSILIPLDIETNIFEPLQDFFDLFTTKNKIERIDINSFIEKFVYNDVDGTIRYKANMELDIEDINKNFDIIYIAQNFINILYNYGQIDIVFPVPDTIGIPLITNFKDINDETFLYKAVKEKDADLVKKLLKVSGIDINAKSKLTGETALHTAISKKCSNISIMLLRYYGIDVNVVNNFNETPLLLSIKIGNNEENNKIINELLSFHNINVSVQDTEKNNVLHNLAMYYFTEKTDIIEKLLFNFEIDVNTKNNDGYTPLELAIEKMNFEMALILLYDARVKKYYLENDNSILFKLIEENLSNDLNKNTRTEMNFIKNRLTRLFKNKLF